MYRKEKGIMIEKAELRWDGWMLEMTWNNFNVLGYGRTTRVGYARRAMEIRSRSAKNPR